MNDQKVFDAIDRYKYIIKYKKADEILRKAMTLNLNSKIIDYIQLTLLDDKRINSNSEDVIVIKGFSKSKNNDIVEIIDEANLYEEAEVNKIDVNKIVFNVFDSLDMNKVYKDFKTLKNSSIVVFLSNISKVAFKKNKKKVIDNLKKFIRELCLIKDEYTRLYFVVNSNEQNIVEDILLDNLSEYFRVNIFEIP